MIRFRLQSLLTTVLIVALLLAVANSHSQTQQKNRDAAEFAAELYRWHLCRELYTSYGSLFPPGLQAIYCNDGDVLDLLTAAGRTDLLSRIEAGETNFRVRCMDGHIMQPDELLRKPYPVYTLNRDDPGQLPSSNALVPSSS